MAIAANEGLSLLSSNIKSAFLQGQSLQRKVYVLPPPEAKEHRKLWLLEKGAYGLIDGSRLFFIELKKTLERLGMRALSGDSAFFTCHKAEKLLGFICIYVDDLLMCGNRDFEKLIVDKLMKQFKFSKLERGKFSYLECKIERKENGDISLNQNTYIEKIEEITVPIRSNDCRVRDYVRKEIRRVVGELL